MSRPFWTKTDSANFKTNLLLAGNGKGHAYILSELPSVLIGQPSNQARVPLEEFQLEGGGARELGGHEYNDPPSS